MMMWNKSIVLLLVLCLSQITFGQKAKKGSDKLVTITGIVVNKDQAPVVGAVIYIDNVETRNITKDDGKYKIKISPSALTLEVRSSLYGNFETPINGQTIINFILDGENSKAALSEKTAKAKGSDENKTKASKTKKMNTYNDIYQMIRAEVNGVIVSGRRIQIQQGHSFFGSSEPLYVVNGVIVPSIDQVNPVEVKRIKVLKGSQAAIYGNRGSNGVIDITLKNGTEKE